MTLVLRRAALIAALALSGMAPLAAAQTYADPQTLALMRQSIDQTRQQIAQLRQMGVDQATLTSLQESLRFLELQYASLAGTGPAPGSPEMVAAERRYLESQYRALVAQRQQLAQMGADAASLAALDQSLAAMRAQINAIGTASAPAAAPGACLNPQLASQLGPNDQWVCAYDPVGPDGRDCTPYFHGQLNRWLVPGGCPMPSAGAPLDPRQNTAITQLPQYPLKPLPKGVPDTPAARAQQAPATGATSGPGARTPPVAGTGTSPSTRRPVSSGGLPTPSPTPIPQFEGAGLFAPLPAVSAPAPTPVLTQPAAQGASIRFCGDPNVIYAKRPECDGAGRITKAGTPAGSGGVNWGQLDRTPPRIETTRPGPKPFDQRTVITRRDLVLGRCQASEVTLTFTSTSSITGKKASLRWSGTPDCQPPPYLYYYLRFELDGMVAWVALWPSTGKSGETAPGNGGPFSMSEDLLKSPDRDGAQRWDAATARRFVEQGRATGFVVRDEG